MPVGPRSKKKTQLFDPAKINLGGDFSGLMPETAPLSAGALPEAQYMAPPMATPGGFAEERLPPAPPIYKAPAPKPYVAPPMAAPPTFIPEAQGTPWEAPPTVTGEEREAEFARRREAREKEERMLDLLVRTTQEEVAAHALSRNEFSGFYNKWGAVQGKSKRTGKPINIADMHDPNRVPVDQLAYAATLFTSDKLLPFFPSERDIYDEILSREGVFGGEAESILFQDAWSRIATDPRLGRAREEIKALYEKFPERKEEYNRILFLRIKERVKELKQPVHAIETPEGKALLAQRKEELRLIQPFFRVMNETFSELGKTRKSLIEQVSAGPRPIDVEPTERQTALAGDLGKLREALHMRKLEGMTEGLAEMAPGEERPTPVTKEGVEYRPETIRISKELVELAKAEGLIDDDLESVTLDMLEGDQLDKINDLATEEQLKEVGGRIQKFEIDSTGRRVFSFPVRDLSPEEFALYATDTLPPEVWTYGLIAAAYRNDEKKQGDTVSLARQYYNILKDSTDPDAHKNAILGIQDVVKDATTFNVYADLTGPVLYKTDPKYYRERLKGIFAYFVPVEMSWFLEMDEPWLYRHGDMRVPVYPVSDQEYKKLITAFEEESVQPLKYMAALSPASQGYLSDRWENFNKNVFLQSNLYGDESTYQTFSNLMGERDVPATFKWNAIQEAGHDKFLGHLTATQMLQWLGNDNFNLSNAPVLHAAMMRQMVLQMKDDVQPSILASNLEALGDLPAMIAYGLAGLIKGSALWVGKTGETLVRLPFAAGDEERWDELSKELGMELDSAFDHTKHYLFSTHDYLLDYFDADMKHLKRRALYELPFVVADFLMMRGMYRGGKTLAARGVHTVIKTKAQPVPVIKTLLGEPRPSYERARGTGLIPFDQRRYTVKAQAAFHRQRVEAAEFQARTQERSERHTYVEEYKDSQHKNDPTRVVDPEPAGEPAPQTKTRVKAEVIEHTNKQVGWLEQTDKPALIRTADRLVAELARRPDSIGRLAKTFRIQGDWGSGYPRIEIENIGAQMVGTQMDGANMQMERTNTLSKRMLVDYAGSPELIEQAQRRFMKLYSAVAVRRENFATNVLEYRIRYTPTVPRKDIILTVREWTEIPEGVEAVPTRMPGEPPRVFESRVFEATRVSDGAVFGEWKSFDEARAALAGHEYVDLTTNRVYALDEILPSGVPENLQLQRIEGPMKEGVQLVDKETGERVFFSTEVSEVAAELKLLGETFVEGKWSENKYRRLLAEEPEGADAYNIVNVKTGQTLENFPSLDEANARLREIGFSEPVEFNVSGAEWARVAGSEQFLRIVQQALSFNATRTNLKLMRDPLNPELGVLGLRVTILDTKGQPHSLDAIRLGLLKEKGNTFELTPQAEIHFRDKNFGDVIYEYGLIAPLDMAEKIYLWTEVLESNPRGDVLLGKFGVNEILPPAFPGGGSLSPTPGPSPPGPSQPDLDLGDIGYKDSPDATIGKAARLEHERLIQVLQESETGEIYAKLFEPQVQALMNRLKIKDRTPAQIAKIFGDQLGVKVVIGEPLTATDIRRDQVVLRILPPGKDIRLASWDAWTLRLPSKDAWMGIEKGIDLLRPPKAEAAPAAPTEPAAVTAPPAEPVPTTEDLLAKEGRYWYEDGDTSYPPVHPVTIKGEKRWVTWLHDDSLGKMWYEFTPETSAAAGFDIFDNMGVPNAYKKKDLIELLQKEAAPEKIAEPLDKASKNFEMVVVRQAMESIAELIVNQMSPIAKLDIGFTIEDGKVYPLINPHLAARGIVRDAVLSGNIKPGEAGAQKRITDAGFNEQTAPRNPSKYSRTASGDEGPRPKKLLTFVEFKKKYPKNTLAQYRSIIQAAIDEGFYKKVLRLDASGKSIVDRDLVSQIIDSSGINLPPDMKGPIFGLTNTGGPIEYKRHFMHFIQGLSVEEAAALGFDHARREMRDTMPYRYMFEEFGLKAEKGLILFDYMADITGRMEVRPEWVAQDIAKILGEEIVLEAKEATISGDHPWLERNNPDKVGIVIVKDAKGKVITRDRWNVAVAKSDLANVDVKTIENFRRAVDFVDLKDDTLGKMLIESGTAELARIVKEGTAADFIAAAEQKKFPSAWNDVKKVLGMEYKDHLRNPIAAVKLAYDQLTPEEITLWDIWRNGTGEMPLLAEVYKSGDNWVKAKLAEEIKNDVGEVVGYKPTGLGLMASAYNIGRRTQHYMSIPFLAMTGKGATGIAPQMHLDFQRVIDMMPTRTKEQRGMKAVIEVMNDLETGNAWLSDPIIAWQRTVLSFAGDLGMFPTKNASLNMVEYGRQVWLSSFQEHRRVASGSQTVTKSPLRERKTADLSPGQIDQLEIIYGLWRQSMPPYMHSGWTVAELNSQIGLAKLLEGLINEGFIHPENAAISVVTAKEGGGMALKAKEPIVPTGFELLDLSEFFAGGTFDARTRWSWFKDAMDVPLSKVPAAIRPKVKKWRANEASRKERVETAVKLTEQSMKRAGLSEAEIKAAADEIRANINLDYENPIIKGLNEKYGRLYGTPQVREILELHAAQIGKWQSMIHRYSRETSALNHLMFDSEQNLLPKAQILSNAVEIYGEDIASILTKTHEEAVALREASPDTRLETIKKALTVVPALFADSLDALAKLSMDINSSKVQIWYKKNALFRSTVRGAARNLVGNGMLTLAHHLNKHPEIFFDPVYYEGLQLYFADGWATVWGGLVEQVGPGYTKPRTPAEVALGRERKKRTTEVEGMEVEYMADSPLPKDVEEFAAEMIKRNVIGNGPTAEFRHEVPSLMANLYQNPRNRAFTAQMEVLAAELKEQAFRMLKETTGGADFLKKQGKFAEFLAAKMNEDTISMFVDNLMQQDEFKHLLGQALEHESYDSVMRLIKGHVVDFPFNTKYGYALEHLVKSLFIMTDDMYRWTYAYWLWKRKGLPPHEIVRELGDYMPDFIRSSPAMHAARLANTWAFWPVKTINNILRFSFNRPVLAGFLRHMSSWLDALEQTEMDPDEMWAHALRPNRERTSSVRTPMGQYSLGYSFYSGDLDTIFDPMGAKHLGATGMLHDAIMIFYNQTFKPRFGEEQQLGDSIDKISYLYWYFLQQYGPRLGLNPYAGMVNLGYEYLDKFQNKNIDIWDPESRGTNFRRGVRFGAGALTKYSGNAVQSLHRMFGTVKDPEKFEALLSDKAFYQQARGTSEAENIADWVMSELFGYDKARRSPEGQAMIEIIKSTGSLSAAMAILAPGFYRDQYLSEEKREELAVEKLAESQQPFQYGPFHAQALEKAPGAAALQKEPSDEVQIMRNFLRAYSINKGENR